MEVRKIDSPFQVDLNMPGSKSITVRDLALAAVSSGTSIVRSPGVCDDTSRMMDSLKRMGIGIDEQPDDVLRIRGNGGRFGTDVVSLDVGQSAASTRTLMGLCALRLGTTHIDGHESMRARPNQYLLQALEALGCRVTSTRDGYLPATIVGGEQIRSSITMKGDKSSQFFTALLLIAPLLPQGLCIDVEGELVSKPYIDITLHEMARFGVTVENHEYRRFIVNPQTYKASDIVVEGDASAASYFAAIATLHGSRVTIGNLGSSTNQGDFRFVEVCERLGARVNIQPTSTTIAGPSGGTLRPIPEPIDMESMPDVAVTLMAMAPFIPGTTRITGLSTLRIKECDRISAPVTEMKKLGIHCVEGPDWVEIPYCGEWSLTESVTIDTYHDHRIAMSFAVLGTKTGHMNVSNPRCVDKTYPNFWRDLGRLYNA